MEGVVASAYYQGEGAPTAESLAEPFSFTARLAHKLNALTGQSHVSPMADKCLATTLAHKWNALIEANEFKKGAH